MPHDSNPVSHEHSELQLGLTEQQGGIQRLYTPAMLAELLDIPITVIRRWHRRKLILPTQEVRRLPYFDVPQVVTAQRLAQLLRAGVSPQNIEKKLADLARLLPSVHCPLLQPSVVVQGQSILVRQGDGLIEAGGQLRLDFESTELPPLAISPELEKWRMGLAGSASPTPESPPALAVGVLRSVENVSVSAEQMRSLAAELEDAGRLSEAADLHRAAMAAAGPDSEGCFQLAELLYRQGDVSGARERYYMAIELDEDYVEARANLGCVLAETGQRELAIAAFEGALRYHPDYADAHYHLARTLDDMGHRLTAEQHWQKFLTLAPESPWAAEAAERLFP
ncbi:MAG: tetratricopeptide repeat protein [Planctomycetota bacterium]